MGAVVGSYYVALIVAVAVVMAEAGMAAARNMSPRSISSVLHGTGNIDGSLLTGALFEVVVGDQPGLASSVANHDAPLLETLDVALVVAADAVADGHEGELVLVEDVAAVGGQFQEPFGEAVVVLLLLDGVV